MILSKTNPHQWKALLNQKALDLNRCLSSYLQFRIKRPHCVVAFQDALGCGPTVCMKKLPTKADLRRELNGEISQYLSSGGTVQHVAAGVSGKDPLNPQKRSMTEIFNGPRQERTPLDHVLADLESRRQKDTKPKPKSRSRPKKKVIYDDFGEPLREVWVEE